MYKLKIPFGLRDGQLLAATDVQNGLPCGCLCPGCGARLVAKHPKEKAAHFAHHNSEACLTGYETALHLAAKQVLLQRRQILVPRIAAQRSLYDKETGAEVTVTKDIKSKSITLDSVEEESRDFEGIVPDIVATFRGKLLFIEIAVTHFVDEIKLEKLKQIGIPTLEIDLSHSPELPTLNDIEQLVIHKVVNRTWLYNPKQSELQQQADSEAHSSLKERITRTLESRVLRRQAHQRYLKLSDDEKLKVEVAATGQPFEVLRPFVGKQVRGGESFGVSSAVWQTAVYRRFIHRSHGDVFHAEEVSAWLMQHLIVSPTFPNAHKVAVWYYLDSLAKCKMLSKLRGQEFMVERDIVGNFPY